MDKYSLFLPFLSERVDAVFIVSGDLSSAGFYVSPHFFLDLDERFMYVKEGQRHFFNRGSP